MRTIDDDAHRMISERDKVIAMLTADRNAWRSAFQEAERKAGLQSVAVDLSSAFPLHDRIQQLVRERDEARAAARWYRWACAQRRRAQRRWQRQCEQARALARQWCDGATIETFEQHPWLDDEQ